jgi:hypothetical protein
MRLSRIPIAMVTVCIATAAWAIESVDGQGVERKPAPNSNSQRVEPLRTGCYTNVTDCAGLSTFRNTTTRDVGCTIWWNNGTGGRSNWTYKPGETHTVRVRYNDTSSCVYIENAPPDSRIQRYYVWVN